MTREHMRPTGALAKRAAANRASCERNMDRLAESIRKDGETKEQAYVRALGTDLGQAMVGTLDDAQEIQRGGFTSDEIEAVRAHVDSRHAKGANR